MGCYFLLQQIFPTQGSNPGLLHCRQTLYHLSHLGTVAVKFSNPVAIPQLLPASMTDLDLLGITWSKQITWKMWFFLKCFLKNLWLSMHKMKFIVFKCTIHQHKGHSQCCAAIIIHSSEECFLSSQTETLYPWSRPSITPPSSPWQPFYFLSMSWMALGTSYKWNHIVYVPLWLISCSIISSRFPPCCKMC